MNKKSWLHLLVLVWAILLVKLPFVAVARAEDGVWTQRDMALAGGTMQAIVVDETGIHLAPTSEIRAYTSPTYTVEVREMTAVYTSTIADIGMNVAWMDVSFTHSGFYYDDFGIYDVTFEARAGYTAVPDNSWSNWIDLTPPLPTSTCAIVTNPYQAQFIDGAMVDLTIPGGRMVCFASTDLGDTTLPTTPHLQYRITITTENDETNVTVNDIEFSYEPVDVQSQGVDPSAVSINHIATATRALSLTFALTLILIGVTYGTYMDFRLRR